MPSLICIGDSLTQGSEASPTGYRSYRGTLQTLLAAAGIQSVDFVGPQYDKPASGGTDGDHAGWGGARMDDPNNDYSNNVTARLSSFKSAYPSVDLIVLYIGWNDVYSVPANIATRYETLLNAVQSGAWAGKKVICCTLHPEPGKTQAQTEASYAAYAQINAKVRALCAAAPSTRILADFAAFTGASQSGFVDQLLSDVQLAPDGTTVNGGGNIQNPGGGSLVSSFASLQAYNAQWSRNPPYPGGAGGGAGSLDPTAESVVNGVNRFTTSVAALVPWFWAYPAPGHASSNTCIEIRNGFAQGKRAGAGWEFFFQGARMGAPLDYSPSLPTNQSVGTGTYQVGWRADGVTSWIKPDGNWGIEVWPRDTAPSRGIVDFFGAFNRDLMASSEAWAWGCQIRLALINPAGVDDRASAKFLVKCGMDLFSPLGGSRYDRYGWPYNVMDGASGRWKLFTGTDWTTVGAVSLGKGGSGSTAANSHWEDPGLQPPLGNWAPATTYNDIPAYSLTSDQVRATPPVVPSYWEATGAGGGTGTGWVFEDYWLNPGTGSRDIHWQQANADRAASIISRAIVSSGALGTGGGGGGGGVIFSPLPGLPAKPNVFLRTNGSSQKNVEPKNWDTSSAPVWRETLLPLGVIGSAYSAQLNASGSPSPTYSIVSGAPAWLTCLSGGALTGTPTVAAAYTVTFRASNATGTADVVATLTVAASLTVTTTSLPSAQTGVPYLQQLDAVGPTPITWSLQSGTLPAGLALSSTGIISGTPTATGSSSITVRATSSGQTADKALPLAVGAANSAPVITSTVLADATVGAAYSQTVAATGATPRTWSVVSGSLPAGLALNTSTGAITGTPTISGGYVVTLRAANAYGSANALLSVRVVASGTPAKVSPWTKWLKGR